MSSVIPFGHELPSVGSVCCRGRGVTKVGSFDYLSGNLTSNRPETATAYTGGRCAQFEIDHHLTYHQI